MHKPIPLVPRQKRTMKHLFLFPLTSRRMQSNRSREKFGGFRTGKYGLRSSTGVAFKIWGGQKKTTYQRGNLFYWLDNGSLPWAVYCAIMSGRLITLDKKPGVHPVGIGEYRRRLFSKTVIKVTGPETTMPFQDDHMCARFQAGIDGVVDGVQAIWDKNSTTEDL